MVHPDFYLQMLNTKNIYESNALYSSLSLSSKFVEIKLILDVYNLDIFSNVHYLEPRFHPRLTYNIKLRLEMNIDCYEYQIHKKLSFELFSFWFV